MAYTKADFESARTAAPPPPPASSSSSASFTADAAPTGAKPGDYDQILRSRERHTKFADPCAVAREESMRCLDKNAYDKAKCTEFFQAYRDCKSTWLEQRREDRRQGKDVA
ncbi:hypothetical protein JCM8547_000464 [Rhodosporidiobolus lusitaniae]